MNYLFKIKFLLIICLIIFSFILFLKNKENSLNISYKILNYFENHNLKKYAEPYSYVHKNEYVIKIPTFSNEGRYLINLNYPKNTQINVLENSTVINYDKIISNVDNKIIKLNDVEIDGSKLIIKGPNPSIEIKTTLDDDKINNFILFRYELFLEKRTINLNYNKNFNIFIHYKNENNNKQFISVVPQLYKFSPNATQIAKKIINRELKVNFRDREFIHFRLLLIDLLRSMILSGDLINAKKLLNKISYNYDYELKFLKLLINLSLNNYNDQNMIFIKDFALNNPSSSHLDIFYKILKNKIDKNFISKIFNNCSDNNLTTGLENLTSYHYDSKDKLTMGPIFHPVPKKENYNTISIFGIIKKEDIFLRIDFDNNPNIIIEKISFTDLDNGNHKYLDVNKTKRFVNTLIHNNKIIVSNLLNDPHFVFLIPKNKNAEMINYKVTMNISSSVRCWR